MKKQLLLTLGLLVCICMQGQVGIGTITPNPSSLLDIQSTTQGFLPPRMTQTQMSAIANPAQGLLVFCSNCTSIGYYFNNGTEWSSISSNGISASGLEIESCVINGTFKQNAVGITRNLTVIYKQTSLASIGTLSFDVSNVTLSGAGATGLTVAASSPATGTFTNINDTVAVVYAISGTPTATGSVTASVDYMSLAQCTSQTSVDLNTVTLDLTKSIDVVSNGGAQGVIDNATNAQSYSIPYSEGLGTNSITFESVTIGGATFSIASTSINNASGTLNVILTASPSCLVPIQNLDETTTLFSINVLCNGTIVGSITVNATGAFPTTVIVSVGGTNTLTFMAHNLGADTSLDPDVPVQAIHGNYYQWGTLAPAADTNTTASAIVGWNTIVAPNGAWADGSKTAQDPCPTGYRVPTKAQWNLVINNNSESSTGTFNNSETNFGVALHLGNLTLPVAGFRATNGALLLRGNNARYWSSTVYSGAYRSHITYNGGGVSSVNSNGIDAYNLRCVSE